MNTLKLLGTPNYFPQVSGEGFVDLNVLTNKGETLELTVWIDTTEELRTPYLSAVFLNSLRTSTGKLYSVSNYSKVELTEQVKEFMLENKVYEGFDYHLQDLLGEYEPIDWS